MNLPVVRAAERHREFVADHASKCAQLCESKVMGVGGLATTDQASLHRDEFKMRLVAVASRLADRKNALINTDLPTAAHHPAPAVACVDHVRNGFLCRVVY